MQFWKHILPVAGLVASSAFAAKPAQDYPIQPVPFTDVHFEDDFWLPRQKTSHRVTIPYCFEKCEETGRISNFAKAGDLIDGEFEGIYFNDSDVYKVVEGAAYSLALQPDPELKRYLDGLLAKFEAAQWDDGYLYTYYTLVDPEKRWTDLGRMHELYCAGHFFEGAVAHYRATGERKALDIALRLADHIDSIFGPDQRHDVPGHQEIEMGLVRLYRVTGEKKYLDLAKFFLDERGHDCGRKLYGAYCQDHKPVIEQSEPVGHAVRAGYMYSGMADAAALTGDEAYIAALDRIWDDVVSHKQYITGGVGSSRSGEAFGAPYELPNDIAYNETCAAIANALWNQRMFLLKGDARYVDVLERVLYNGFLVGVSLDGDEFFYPNPLSADGVTPFNQGAPTRKGWFGCSCCPVNVARFVPSLAGYVYAQSDDAIYVNLFAGGTGTVSLEGNEVKLTQKTDYPWDGEVEITVEPEKAARFAIRVRIPGWATGSPMPSDLYRYLDESHAKPVLKVNGKAVELKTEKGYATIDRQWKAGDTIDLSLPMPIRRVLSHPKVEADAGRVALERGPIVYCIEAADNGGRVFQLAVADDAALAASHRGDLLSGVTVIEGDAIAKRRGDDGEIRTEETRFVAIPYYAWCHRGAGEMTVWIPRTPELAQVAPEPTIATESRPSASHCWGADTVQALNDGREPEASHDSSIPRFTWWPRRGSTEWVQYDFDGATDVAGVEVYWFDDTGAGSCRVPKSWRVLYRDGDGWKPVSGVGEYGVAEDRFNAVKFDPVKTDALRVEVELKPEFSSGILEWCVNAAK